MPNMPRKRERKTGSGSGNIGRRGSGLGFGSVGHNQSGASHISGHSTGSGNSDLGATSSGSGSSSNRGVGTSLLGSLLSNVLSGKLKYILIILVVVLLITGKGCNIFSSLFSSTSTSGLAGLLSSSDSSSGDSSSLLSSIISSDSGWALSSNSGKLDTTVATGTPSKRTNLIGNGKDTVNILVYMCGADLESESGAATADLQEMLNATIGDNINLIVYTGGASKWQNQIISSKCNQIYQIKGGSMYELNGNAGNSAMTNPDTLSGFIKWVGANYPSSRNMLIFWDHGGGSVSGFGYDENYSSNGSMSLSGINKALKAGGMTFDVIGFDACLMATLENGLMLSNYADYLIGSEEVEPGYGWYYTDWLTALNNDTSMSTLELGKQIADDYTNHNKNSGYSTTFSLVDLAELAYTVPDKLAAFAASTNDIITSASTSSDYGTVSEARTGTREFGVTTKLDQIDLVHFATNIGTSDGQALADALLGAIKYNKTSSSMTNAYGLAIYFPYYYNVSSYVSSASEVYSDIGITDEYTKCIKNFAATECGSQAVYESSYGFDIASLLTGSSSNSSSSSNSLEFISSILSSYFGTDKSIDIDTMAKYIYENQIDTTQLVWTQDEDGNYILPFTDSQWNNVTEICVGMYYDDGEGFYDLGYDNYYEINDASQLKALEDRTWLSIDGNTIAYYFGSITENGDEYTITGYTPILYNGELAQMILVFDSENPYGYIAGGTFIYVDGETDTVAKPSIEFAEGDQIDFIADYYSYTGEYLDTYRIGNQWSYTADATIENLTVADGNVRCLYRIIDNCNNTYYTDAMP